MNDSVFDVNEIAQVIAEGFALKNWNQPLNELRVGIRKACEVEAKTAAEAVVKWLDEHVIEIGWRERNELSHLYRIVQPEDQK